MNVKRCFGDYGLSSRTGLFVFLCLLLSVGGLSQAQERRDEVIRLLERHAVNKQKVLDILDRMPALAMTQCFAMNYRDINRRIIIDGEYQGTGKRTFLERAARMCDGELAQALRELSGSHQDLFGAGENKELMVRPARDPAFKPFGLATDLQQAMARITEGNKAEVQAFQTIFETGQNTRGYIHKLECHAGVVEFVYAATDIVYGVMLPGDLEFGSERVVADPTKVRLFYVRAGEVIALHPYVLHSGSLSVEPDRSFSVIIYKKPVTGDGESRVRLPDDWAARKGLLKIPDVDKYYLTLDKLHTAELAANRGYITDKRPLRLPVLK